MDFIRNYELATNSAKTVMIFQNPSCLEFLSAFSLPDDTASTGLFDTASTDWTLDARHTQYCTLPDFVSRKKHSR